MKKIGITILAVFIFSLTLFAVENYEYNKEITLNGTLITEMYYGAPGFGEDKKHDKKVYPFILLLDRKISINGNKENEKEEGVKKIQLSFPYEQIEKIRTLKNKKVKVIGELYHADNGNHFTNVLIDVKRIMLKK